MTIKDILIKLEKIIASGNENEEEWLPIKGYEKRYRISNLGNIWSNQHKRLLNGCFKGHYLSIKICDKHNKKKIFYIHRLVAEHFVDKFGSRKIYNCRSY